LDGWRFRLRGVVPHQKTASERIRVVSHPAPWRQLVEELRVAAAKHDIVRFESGDQSVDDIKNVLPPSLLA
jgi:hypothetical protein